MLKRSMKNRGIRVGGRSGNGRGSGVKADKSQLPRNSIAFFGCSPGEEASDGSGTHGAFTENLLSSMSPTERITDTFASTIERIEEQLGDEAQNPINHSTARKVLAKMTWRA